MIFRMEKHKGTKCVMKFPESEFRLEYGNSGAHASWEDAFEWVKFAITEISPNQTLPRDWNKWTEFIYRHSKQYGWFQYIEGRDEFLPQSEYKHFFHLNKGIITYE